MNQQSSRSSRSSLDLLPPFRCSHSPCEKKFLRREHLTRHEQSHAPEREFKCPECPKAFTRNDILKRHMALHTNASSAKRVLIACTHCRRRKLKCDASSPCSHCVSSQLECRREEILAQCQQSSRIDTSSSSWDEGSIGSLDLSIAKFGQQGWCPGRSATRAWQTYVA